MRAVRGIAGAVIGAALGALVGYSSLRLAWGVTGALAGAALGALAANYLEARLAEGRRRAEEAGIRDVIIDRPPGPFGG